MVRHPEHGEHRKAGKVADKKRSEFDEGVPELLIGDVVGLKFWEVDFDNQEGKYNSKNTIY